jgi:tRNA pseudouridine38-40 synthase
VNPAKTFKLTLEYDGTRYSGWQDQQNARTVMGELKHAATKFFAAKVDIQGAGRTDAGVHARAQVAHLRVNLTTKVSTADIVRGLNAELPKDIVVLDASPAPPSFHARHDALHRAYTYQISTRKTAFFKPYVWWIKDPLDIPLMAEAASQLPGRHDFTCFRASDPSRPGESPIVVVNAASIEPKPLDGLVLFRIEASHFVWRMVRRLAGTLVKLGLHEITLEDWEQLLAARPNPKLDVAAWTAPSSGLFLERVHYPARGI